MAIRYSSRVPRGTSSYQQERNPELTFSATKER